MSERVQEGSEIQLTVDLPVGSKTDRPVIPAGTCGVVQRVYTDALGGYQVRFNEADHAVSAIVYPSQFIKRRPREPIDPHPVQHVIASAARPT